MWKGGDEPCGKTSTTGATTKSGKIVDDDAEFCQSLRDLHLGIDAANLPDAEKLEMHHVWVGNWDKGVDAEQNLVLISIPSIKDPSMAPEGKHVIHAYTPGNEPLSLWENVKYNSEEYNRLKKERSKVLYQAVAKALNNITVEDLRSRAEIEMVGTPLTHARFLRRENSKRHVRRYRVDKETRIWPRRRGCGSRDFRKE